MPSGEEEEIIKRDETLLLVIALAATQSLRRTSQLFEWRQPSQFLAKPNSWSALYHRCWSRGARQLFFLGTRLPFLRALERPIAIACLRLFTLPPLPPRPLLAVPFLYRRISLSTSRFELRAYLVLFFFFAAIVILPQMTCAGNLEGNPLNPCLLIATLSCGHFLAA